MLCRLVGWATLVFILLTQAAFAQVIDFEDFGTGSYPGPELPPGQTSYTYNAPAQLAIFPNIVSEAEYVLATDSQQGFVNWASVADNTTGSGYMMLVNADSDQSGEFYRRQVSLSANTTFDFISHIVNVNSQGDFDFCTANQGGLVLPNVTLQIEDSSGAILGSMNTGDIPFDPTPEWEEYGLVFTTSGSTTSVDVVLINNAVGSCGNDLAIDDIIFRVAVTMEASDDSVTLSDTSSAQSAILMLGSNDTLNGNPLPGTELYSVATGSTLPAGFSLDPNTGEVDVAAGTAGGTYTFDYSVCETSNMFNCDIATATIIIDVEDPNAGGVCPAGTTSLAGTHHVLSATGGSNPNGALGVPLPEGGEGTDGNSGRTFFPSVIYDLTGDPLVSVPEGTVIDVSLGSHFNSIAQIAISGSLDDNNFPAVGSAGSQLANLNNTDNIFIYFDYTVPAGGIRFIELDHQFGGIRFDGVIFDTLCTPPPPVPVTAQNDNGAVPDSSLGDSFVLNILTNDTIDGAAPTSFTLALANGASLPSGVTFDVSTGDVSVPQGTFTGQYSFDYELCQAGLPTNCKIATVTIDVTNLNPPSICPLGTTPINGLFHVLNVTPLNGNPNNPNGALGAPLPEGSQDNNSNQTGVTFSQSLIYDLTGDPDIIVPEGTVINVSFANHFNSNPTANILTSLDGTTFSSPIGSSSGPWINNTFRYDPFTVPSGGLRFLQVAYGGGGGLRFDGVIYETQCQAGGPPPAGPVSLSAQKTVTVYDPDALGLHALPGNDVIYTISVENSGDDEVDSGSLLLIDSLPPELMFYNGDIDDAGPEQNPVSFQDTAGSLTLDFNADVGFSNGATKPADFADCTYAPIAGHDPSVTYICFNPKGVMSGQSTWSVSFRARIK